MRNFFKAIAKDLADCAEMIDIVVSKGNL